MAARELAVAGRHEHCHKKLSEHTKALPPLQIGDHVAIQNQHGNQLLKWDKRGVIVSCEDFDKYGVKVLGPSCLTYQKRQYLRQYTPELLRTDHRQQDMTMFYPADYSQPTARPSYAPERKTALLTHQLQVEPVPVSHDILDPNSVEPSQPKV